MCGADDHWVKAAMADDTVVVDLLLRLHGTVPKPRILNRAPPLPLKWSVRQRRSRPASSGGNQKKQAQRASPATPLSWSGATSISGGSGGGGVGGDEESSRPAVQTVSAVVRSKVNSDGERTASKRSRKKKTLAELRDEEKSLLKERRELKRDLAALRLDIEKERTTNQKLKRMKVESQPLPDREPPVAEELNSDRPHQKTIASASHSVLPIVPPTISSLLLQPSTSNIHPKQEADDTSTSKFELPDLNLPFEESPCPEVTFGVSGVDYIDAPTPYMMGLHSGVDAYGLVLDGVESQPLPDREPPVAEESNSDRPHQKTIASASHSVLPIVPPAVSPLLLQPSTSNIHPKQEADDTSNSKFELPDLNPPFEESPCPEVTFGVS